MDAEALLSPSDAAKFDSIVLGGILGNFPSEDRTAEVRVFEFPQRRHLGPDQVANECVTGFIHSCTRQAYPPRELSHSQTPAPSHEHEPSERASERRSTHSRLKSAATLPVHSFVCPPIDLIDRFGTRLASDAGCTSSLGRLSSVCARVLLPVLVCLPVSIYARACGCLYVCMHV
eukprot:GHVU01017693.1.p1 GENE.GHVU01017693.1~~GHVU01017693.1.p1  ORF type:complete len:175 (-),score=12.11 GHVU01017693.1:305-829(-)